MDYEIRIIDITVPHQYRSQNTGTEQIVEILRKCKAASKFARIYIENFILSAILPARFGLESNFIVLEVFVRSK